MKNIVQFLSEVKLELGKVVWPKFDEFVGSTIVVLLLVVVFSIYLGVVDLGITKLMGLIFKTFSNYYV